MGVGGESSKVVSRSWSGLDLTQSELVPDNQTETLTVLPKPLASALACHASCIQ